MSFQESSTPNLWLGNLLSGTHCCPFLTTAFFPFLFFKQCHLVCTRVLYACVCTGLCRDAQLCYHWRWRLISINLSLVNSSSFFFFTQSLWPEIHYVGYTDWTASLSIYLSPPTSLGVIGTHWCAQPFCEFWELGFGSSICIPSTLPTEPSLQPPYHISYTWPWKKCIFFEKNRVVMIFSPFKVLVVGLSIHLVLYLRLHFSLPFL